MTEARTVGGETAGQMLGIGRALSYQLAARGEFPCRVLKIGRLYRVPVADLERVLGEREPVAVAER